MITVVICGEPPVVENARDVGDQTFEYFSNFTDLCDERHALRGADVIYCQANGSWTSPPYCEGLCVRQTHLGLLACFHEELRLRVLAINATIFATIWIDSQIADA